MLYLLVGGLLGFGYDLVHNAFLRMTSALTLSVMGNTKLLALITISMATLERQPSLAEGAGVAMALGGVLWYTVHRHLEARHKQSAMAAVARVRAVDDCKH